MGSLGGGEVGKKKAMWLYPKVMGFNPSERWGHSSCYSNGFLYVFGGCCGGLHFSDILVLNLNTMAWNTLVTTGFGPGPRDSHTTVLFGPKMIVFGGTNGSKKVNDLHALDLRSREWVKPECKGLAPSPRESHTCTLVGDERLVIFGGSGEGEGNYLNDLHVLDLKTMRWSSPAVKGNRPVPRDSHSAVAVASRVFVYGGDCGDRYNGDVDVLDMESMTWSRLIVQGPLPGVRAGHAAVHFGTKIYIIGGVGDKRYYNDVWVLDVTTCSWTELEICGQQPQGRFSHTAIVTNSDIAIYGGCGEDERPLNELLVLQLGDEHPSGRYNVSMCKIFGSHWSQEKRNFAKDSQNNSKTLLLGDEINVVRRQTREREPEKKQSLFRSDNLHPKRHRMGNSKVFEVESEPEEHSLSLSQHSSPSQSDQEQTPIKKPYNSLISTKIEIPFLNQKTQIQNNFNSNNAQIKRSNSRTFAQKLPKDFHIVGEHLKQPNPETFPHLQSAKHLIGAEIHGKVDGAFDSGYLMTATVNGRIFRGVLFAPAPEISQRGGVLGQSSSSLRTQTPVASQHHSQLKHPNPAFIRQESGENFRQAQASKQSILSRNPPSLGRDLKLSSELQGVVLSLGGPGSGHA